MKTLLIVRPANDNLFILPFHQSNKVVACDCHCFNNCLISKVCAQISNSLSYPQISKRPSAAIIITNIQISKRPSAAIMIIILVMILKRKKSNAH